MKIILLLISLFLTSLLSLTPSMESNTAQTTPVKENQEVTFIAVVDVSGRSIDVSKHLNEALKETEESEEVKDMHIALTPYSKVIKAMLAQDNYKYPEYQTVRELQKMGSEVAIHLKQLKEWDLLCREDIEKFDRYRQDIKKQIRVWDETYVNAQKENVPESILQQIITLLTEINSVDNGLKIKYDRALTSSQLITVYIVALSELNESLIEAERKAMNRIFFKNQVSFITLLKENDSFFIEYFKSVVKIIDEKYSESKSYILTNSDLWLKWSIVSFISLVFVAFYNYLYRKKRLFVRKASLEEKIFFFMGRPFATYSILFILGFTFVFSERSQVVAELVTLFVFIPVIRVLQTVTKKHLHKYIYLMFLFWILLWMEKNSINYELESRIVMLFVSLSLLMYTVQILFKRTIDFIEVGYIRKVAKSFLSLFTILLIVAIGANLYGSVLLSSRIIDGVISTYYTAMIFYALYVILTGYIVVILRRRIATASNMLDIYSSKIERVTSFLIKIWMFAWWLLIIVKKVSLYPYLVEIKESLLTFSFNIAETTISVNAVLNFVLIVIGTWVLARLTKTILEVEIFARFKLPRGAPTAILTTLNYIIIISGTIIAFSSLGVSPQQFALMFGALGVGIGFGLRNIIANFVSGIIMVFERPIQIGDTIEVDKTMGTVQGIGARSSTVKTFDGSEVIIPNADFIAKEIINWTLSDHYRRKTVEFKVDLENDIDSILKIMQDVAESHPDVLKDPKPLATFKSFGEYYLEFKLYFWLSENLIVAQSEVNIGVYKALKEAGISMPIPQQNVNHLEKK